MGTPPHTLTIDNPHVWICPLIAAIISVGALITVWINRKSAVRGMSESPRLFACVSAIGTITAFFSWGASSFVDLPATLENQFKPIFWLPCSIFIISLACVVGCIFLNFLHGRAKNVEDGNLKSLRKSLDANNRRREAIREIVNTKSRNVRQACKLRGPSTTPLDLAAIRQIFHPERQIGVNFAALYKGIRQLMGPKGSLRIAIFFPTPANSAMKVGMSYDGTHFDCITTPNGKWASKFRINSTGSKCLAVHAATNGGLHVIPDTFSMNRTNRKKFDFFDERQKTEIKSISVYAYVTDDTGPYPVICADSNRKNAFQADDDFLGLLLLEFEEFGHRLLFEIDVHRLLG